MSASVQWTGLAELIRALEALPDEMRAEAMEIVGAAADGAAAEIVQSYAVGPTGNLRSRVRVEKHPGALLIAKVVSAAPHSHLWEFGTQQRRTSAGANRGTMPAHPETPGIAQRWRARMYEQLKALVERKGFTLSET